MKGAMSNQESSIDYSARVDAVRRQLANSRVDLLAVSPSDDTRYLLGFSPVADERPCYLLVTPGRAVYVVPELNADQARAHTSIPVISWADAHGPDDALTQAFRELGDQDYRTVAVDDTMRADFLLRLQKLMPNARYTVGSEVIGRLRQRKSSQEIALMRASAKTADNALLAAVQAIRPGVTEMEVAEAAAREFRRQGVEEVSFTIVASGPNGAFPHHYTSKRVIEEGDSVIIDLAATLDGYSSDVTRTAFVGTPTEEWKKVYSTVLEANQNAEAVVRPGIKAREVDIAARSTIERAGYGQYFLHRTGHGIGLNVHEPPWITSESDIVLEEGMAFSIEPGVYLPGRFGVRIENIVVVTSDGRERLTGLSLEPMIVGN